MRALPLLLLTSFLLPGLPAAAEVYRWTDANGVVHYGDKAPDAKAKPAQLPQLQVIPGTPAAAAPGKPAGASDPTAEPAPAAEKPRLSIAAPQPEQVIRDTSRQLSVRVDLQSPLPEGAGLIYYLDGVAQNAQPTQERGQIIGNVDRGSHLVDVGVVDRNGKPLVRTPPVIVHVMPPGKH
ncbi:DUF4124 domain-containing protein [Hydrocarboniphaga effusa]|uniref:DUF4124 domain-containing protein n=1 Tax=Hydrocarboniphaga effusa TaxID=243629 RepID=UPI00398C0B2B